jgi:hypothetical protein
MPTAGAYASTSAQASKIYKPLPGSVKAWSGNEKNKKYKEKKRKKKTESV